MSKLVRFKSLNLHPDYHNKLKMLAVKNYRSLTGQLEYLIDSEIRKENKDESSNQRTV